MINNDIEFEASLDALALMYRSLAACQRDRVRFNYSDAWFSIMAEGPLEEIQRIEADLRAYTGRDAIQTPPSPPSQADNP